MVQEILIKVANAAKEAQNSIPPLPHAPRTYINPTRALQTLNHMLDNVAFLDPGSDAASLITLNPEDRDQFRVPSFALSFWDYIYSSLAKWIADEDIKDKEDIKSKQNTNDKPKLTAEEAHIAKRQCMNGKNLVPWIMGVPWQARFLQSLFDTKGCIAGLSPNTFFLNNNLQILNAEAATLPTVKTNPNPGETKGISILDVDKLSTRFGKELSLTCSQWTRAVGNIGDAHSEWYNDHFNFYQVQRSKVKLYDAWKLDELKFHQEHWANYGAFKGYQYERAFALSKKQHKMMAKICEIMAMPNNGRPSSSTTNCLICSERGHNSRIRSGSTMPVKFKDGKPTWAKSVNHALVTPDNWVLCINWNVRGSNATCAHSKDKQVHLCSFCGQKGHHYHHAFSWTCRSPSN
ncbi:hypothetical protein BYT27DRAFT_7220601 [Phlegmacium glaucopus]|nr:hypothetical protein BYT27DRAFT_7220601 [Phlegmacium glaucopus]